MDFTGAQDWAAPAATVVAALLAGTFARVANTGRLNRLRAAVELREQIDSSQRGAWKEMIARDTEAVMRQAALPPMLAIVATWLGVVTSLIGSRGANAPLTYFGFAMEGIGVAWLIGWWILRYLETYLVMRRLKAESKQLDAREQALIAKGIEQKAEIAHLEAAHEAQMARIRAHSEQRRQYSRQLLLATGAPMRMVNESHNELLDALDADREPRQPHAIYDHLKRPTWRLRRWYRWRKYDWAKTTDQGSTTTAPEAGSTTTAPLSE